MARFHFIGICGTAMATLAAMMKARGHVVQGSDAGVYPPMSDFLAREGITVFDGYEGERITPEIDRVVVGNAISRGNAELEAVLDRKVRFTSLPELLRDEFLWQSRSVVIAGTHGKTTTTSLTAWLFTACGRIPACSSAALPPIFDGSYRMDRAATSSSRATSTTARSSTRPRSS
jgi:UDP-N-acetylmuramate: L-alanyl-gamma-D-glutamyl-meso-diaminopimelate ligase